MANRKNEVYKVGTLTEGKRNLIAGLLSEYDIQTADDIQAALKCIFRLNGTASPRQRKGCPLQTGSLLLVNSGYACSFHSVQGGTPYE